MRKEIGRQAAGLPAPRGPYSPVVRYGTLLFVSGQVPIDPATQQVVSGGIREQTRQVLENVRALLEANGSSLQHVLKTTCFLRTMEDFAAFNEVYAGYFPEEPPARTTVQAGRLPLDVAVEIDVIAAVPS